METIKKYAREAAFWAGSAFFAILVIDAFLNPPSKNRYNPHKTYDCETAACEGFVLGPDISASGKAKDPSDYLKEEQWRSERSDLAAQWETADRTRLAFRAAMLGVWLLIWTIFETKGAARFAEQTLNENTKANKRGQRAYLSVISIKTEVERENFPVTVSVRIENTGATPAHNIKIWRIFEEWDENNNDLINESGKTGSWGSLGSKCIKTAQIDIDDANLTRAVIAGQIRITIIGVIQYDDAFGEEHLTFFNAGLIAPPSIYGVSFSIAENGNKMT